LEKINKRVKKGRNKEYELFLKNRYGGEGGVVKQATR